MLLTYKLIQIDLIKQTKHKKEKCFPVKGKNADFQKSIKKYIKRRTNIPNVRSNGLSRSIRLGALDEPQMTFVLMRLVFKPGVHKISQHISYHGYQHQKQREIWIQHSVEIVSLMR